MPAQSTPVAEQLLRFSMFLSLERGFSISLTSARPTAPVMRSPAPPEMRTAKRRRALKISAPPLVPEVDNHREHGARMKHHQQQRHLGRDGSRPISFRDHDVSRTRNGKQFREALHNGKDNYLEKWHAVFKVIIVDKSKIKLPTNPFPIVCVAATAVSESEEPVRLHHLVPAVKYSVFSGPAVPPLPKLSAHSPSITIVFPLGSSSLPMNWPVLMLYATISPLPNCPTISA